MQSLSCLHIRSPSSDWERQPCPSKYFDQVSVCLRVPVLRWSLQFLVRDFTFLSLILFYVQIIVWNESYWTSLFEVGHVTCVSKSGFVLKVVELLRHAPQCSLPFNKFIPAYHHHYGHQCRVADYGFTKLIELFEAIPEIAKVFLSL